ncbi:hypothetical protein CAXC1_110018 [Candidatus Xenohaliotis californiensis]|uniref:Redoxin domain-containing protein n=1 Tax=Candidatus Xenohaliotis californiensis TaxID=84677 RepID=A0ABP0ERJ1_9RICK|nr:hypothetical protein CAXC1_110018 [Candidatus Xenohaliotis californiensis]
MPISTFCDSNFSFNLFKDSKIKLTADYGKIKVMYLFVFGV